MADITAKAAAKRLVDEHSFAVLMLRVFAFGTTLANARWADMPHRIKQQVRTAIDTPELRRAIRIMDNIHEAMELLTQLSPPALEALRDALKEMAEDRTGPRGDLKAAWFQYTQKALDDARVRERQEVFGLHQDIKRA
jgi:hypothetical protein